MAYLDRLIIGMMISVAAVAYYSTPFDVVTKLLLIPGSLVGVLFPALSTSFNYDIQQTKQLYSIGLRYIFFALFPFTLILVFFSKEMLSVWLGEEFALNSFYVAQILAVGVLVNGIASIPFALIQAAKRPDITAKIHLLELPLYLISIWGLINACGICGAALAWLLRVTVDAVFLMIIASRILKNQELGITPSKVFFFL
jgi:O-antigen/teichoic acid export membrane protein